MKEITAMIDGYIRRHDRMEDMLIIYCALPVYRSMLGGDAPTYEEMTAYRKKRDGPTPEEQAKYEKDVDYWSKMLDKLPNKIILEDNHNEKK